MNKAQLYSNVDRIRTRLLLDGFTYPLNICDIGNKYIDLAVSSVPFKTKGLRGMAVLAKDAQDVNCIIINSLLSSYEQNFYGFHELMHITFESEKTGQIFSCYERTMPFQDSYKEWVANEGAAELLMPYKLFITDFCYLYDLFHTNRNLWIQYYDTFTPVELLAKKYHVSTMVVKNRIRNLSYEIQQYHQGIDIDSIRILSNNQQKSLGIQSFDYESHLDLLELQYGLALDWDSVISIE